MGHIFPVPLGGRLFLGKGTCRIGKNWEAPHNFASKPMKRSILRLVKGLSYSFFEDI